MRSAGILCIGIALAHDANATPPCMVPIGQIDGLVAPQDGEVSVPTNALLLINPSNAFGDPIVTVEGVELAFSKSMVNYSDGSGRGDLLLIHPAEPFPPDSTVTVNVDTRSDAIRSFVTGPNGDETRPGAPSLGGSRPFSDGACDPYVEIDVSGDGTEAYFVAATENEPSLTEDGRINGLSLGEKIVVGGPASQTRSVFVAAVDTAGNMGPSAEVEVTFPEGFTYSGCGPAPASQFQTERPTAMITAVLAGLAFAMRRRRPNT